MKKTILAVLGLGLLALASASDSRADGCRQLGVSNYAKPVVVAPYAAPTYQNQYVQPIAVPLQYPKYYSTVEDTDPSRTIDAISRLIETLERTRGGAIQGRSRESAPPSRGMAPQPKDQPKTTGIDAVISTHCLACHSGETAKKKFRLDIDLDKAPLAVREKALARVVRLPDTKGVMPPSKGLPAEAASEFLTWVVEAE